jgi:hypothetical protein
VSRRQSRILIACAVWTLYVWISRIVIMSGQDNSFGFKLVHGILAGISIAFGLAVGKIGWDARRGRPSPEGERAPAGVGQKSPAEVSRTDSA